jgi:signal transduction histidine kinase
MQTSGEQSCLVPSAMSFAALSRSSKDMPLHCFVMSRALSKLRDAFLGAIGEACDRLEVIVNQLLELSQLERGLLVPTFMPMDLEQVVREAVTGATARLDTTGLAQHRLTVQVVDTNALPLVQADPRLLRDALDSVLENALTSSPAGSTIHIVLQEATLSDIGTGDVSPASAALARAVAVMSVQDTEMGMPAEHGEGSCAPVHPAESRLTGEGDGLGMALVARIVALHGGRVWGERTLGAGSTLCLALPLASEEAAADAGGEDGEDPSAGVGRSRT